MKLRDQILKFLEDNQGKLISGEEIAKKFGVSRNSVWKAINVLRNEGINVVSKANSGYVLDSDTDVYSANRIKNLSKNNIEIIMKDEITSTNDVAKELALNGAREGTVVVAKRQLKGRGRMGRSFISNEENGIYMSLILRPKLPIDKSVYITVIGAVAALEAIESTSNKKCDIKWVNDIYIDNKKVCGILTEASFNFETEQLDYAIVGIGINVTPPKNGFSKEIKDIATSIYDDQSPKGYKSLLCATIIDRILHYYNNMENRNYIKLYKERSNLIGKLVDVYRANEVISGVVVSIDDNANLIVKSGDKLLAFNSGEARVRKK